MRVFNIGVAGRTIEVRAMFTRVYNICKDFMTGGIPDFSVESTMQDFDRVAAVYEALYNRPAPSDVDLEEYSTLEKVSECFVEYDIYMMHGAVVANDGLAYLFTAPSGTGKTTHILKWLKHCPDAFVVNGDKPFIRLNDDGTVLACGAPWAGKENLYTNTMVPLKAIILMERAEDNHIERISFAEAFPKLLQQTYRPEDPDKMRKTLKLMQRLNPAVSFWRFQCNNFKDDCFDVAYNALVGQDQ